MQYRIALDRYAGSIRLEVDMHSSGLRVSAQRAHVSCVSASQSTQACVCARVKDAQNSGTLNAVDWVIMNASQGRDREAVASVAMQG
ncbi:hypothetical protein LJ655_01175 [Paraburkholderia sp. MMS20-SJTN17]|uniref:Uncharacterized protein n=1 Tax=Paraburkholderia translucens TaxID=2886945 RepID=A0ABS8K6Z5_9BURK|nr:hypothetical protein [Paraburkholderia sp. MMS20-SJTN17]MCC8400516.1 hypothetical protein [Paraburkholderia sp. MMS20-SJTN17]